MEQVPNASEKTGVSRDYILVFGAVDNYIRRIEKNEEPRWLNLSKNTLLHRPILRYEEHFPPGKYENVVNGKNKETITRLNEVVDEINRIRESGNLDVGKLKELWIKANSLING